MSVKMEPEGQDCCCNICFEVISDSDTVIVNEDVLVLLRFLILQIDVSSLQNTLICAACLEKINEAHQLKILHQKEHKIANVEIKEIDCDEKFIKCYICKNATELNSSTPLFNSSYTDILCYFISKEEADKVNNPQICDTCQISLSNVHIIMNSLSVYDRSKIKSEVKTEPTINANGSKVEVGDPFSNEEKFNINIENIKEEMKEEGDTLSENLQIKQEELDLKLDLEAGPSNAGMLEHTTLVPATDSPNEAVESCSSKERNRKSTYRTTIKDNIKTFICQVCQYETQLKDQMTAHISSHTNRSERTVFKCNLCNYQSKRKYHLIRHAFSHKNVDEQGLYSCSNCPFQTKYKKCLKQHVMRIHGKCKVIQAFKCRVCQFQTKSRSDLMKHKLDHEKDTDTKQFKCDQCEFQTNLNGSFKQHLLTHRNENVLKAYKCDICSFQTRYKSNLNKHVIIHKNSTETVMYKCDHCEYRTKHRRALKIHCKLKHKNINDIQLFKCTICDYQSRRQSYLTAHIASHNSPNAVEMFSCNVCEYQSKYKSNLNKHMIIHKSSEETEMFECDECEYRTRHKPVLKTHYLLKHKDVDETEMFKCTFCEYQCKRKGYLTKHMLHHKDSL